MPGTQPRETLTFDPGNTSQLVTQVLDTINAEMDGAEDQVGPSLDSPMDNMPAAHALATSPLITPDLGSSSSRGTFPVGPSAPWIPAPLPLVAHSLLDHRLLLCWIPAPLPLVAQGRRRHPRLLQHPLSRVILQ